MQKNVIYNYNNFTVVCSTQTVGYRTQHNIIVKAYSKIIEAKIKFTPGNCSGVYVSVILIQKIFILIFIQFSFLLFRFLYFSN